MSNVTRISMSLEDDLLARFDAQVERRGYPTRSEAIKALMRQSLVADEWADNEVVAGAITMVYDHHRRGLTSKVMDVQHDFSSLIVSTQHVHLDHDHCLEIVIVKGVSGKIARLVAALKAIKGIMHNELVMTTAGHGDS